MIEHRDDLEGKSIIVAVYEISQQWVWIAALSLTAAGAWLYPLALATGLLGALPPVWRRVRARWHSDRVRGAWTRTIIEAGGADPPKKTSRRRRSFVGPRPMSVIRTPSGDRVQLRSPTGYSSIDDEVLDRVRAALDVRDVRLERDPNHGSRATAIIERRDSLHNHPAIPHPLLTADTASVWDPNNLGLDDDHQPITLHTMGNGHVLVAGITGSGKTVAMNGFIAQAALDPLCRITIIDGAGGVDYTPWATVATIIDDDVETAADTLEAIRDKLTATKTDLVRGDKNKIGPGDPTHRIILDEAGFYFQHPDKDQAQRFTRAYLDLMQRGRKFGLQFILGMQRPAATIISTDVRAQFGYRICFRTGDRETTRMVFPETEAPQPHMIPENGYAGVGYLKGEGGQFRRFKAPLLTRDDIRTIASRGSALRADRDLAELQKTTQLVEANAWAPESYATSAEETWPEDGKPFNTGAPSVKEPGPQNPSRPQQPNGSRNADDESGRSFNDAWTVGPGIPQSKVQSAWQDEAAPEPTRDQIRQAIVDVLRREQPLNRDKLNDRLKRRAPGWHVQLRLMVDEGLVQRREVRVPGKPGRPPVLYVLPDTGGG